MVWPEWLYLIRIIISQLMEEISNIFVMASYLQDGNYIVQYMYVDFPDKMIRKTKEE